MQIYTKYVSKHKDLVELSYKRYEEFGPCGRGRLGKGNACFGNCIAYGW